MDADTTKPMQKKPKNHYKERTKEEMEIILKNKDRRNTQQATEHAICQLNDFLQLKSNTTVNAITKEELAGLLSEFYCSVQPQRKDDYCVQSLKCLRAALNRFFRQEKGFDIVKDPPFVKSNEMFKAILVDVKKNGLGVRHSYEPISQIDLERIAEYFCNDYVTLPNPRKLQQNIIFFIIYYFCRRGRENLYMMTQNTFEVRAEPDGKEYIFQAIDEIDKNHGPEDVTQTNQGKIYATNGEI